MPDSELSEEAYLNIVERLGQAGIYNLTVTGGEPLLRKRIALRVISKARTFGMDVGLNTNAVLINERTAGELRDTGLDHALVSILGTKTTHDQITGLPGAYQKACRGLKYLLNANISVAVNMVATKQNQTEIAAVGKEMAALGIKTFCVTPMVPSCEGNKTLMLDNRECKSALRELMKLGAELAINIDTLEPLPRCLFDLEEDSDFRNFFGNRLCSAGISTCVISAEGFVRPCIHADISYGNLLLEPLKNIWEKMNPWSSSAILPSDCVECNAVHQCQGGCRMSAKIFTGQYNGRDAYMTQAIKDPTRNTCRSQTTTSARKISPDELFSVNRDVRVRKESFGGVFSIRGKISFLTWDGIKMIEQLTDKGYFTANDLSVMFGIDETTASNTLNILITTGLVKPHQTERR